MPGRSPWHWIPRITIRRGRYSSDALRSQAEFVRHTERSQQVVPDVVAPFRAEHPWDVVFELSRNVPAAPAEAEPKRYTTKVRASVELVAHRGAPLAAVAGSFRAGERAPGPPRPSSSSQELHMPSSHERRESGARDLDITRLASALIGGAIMAVGLRRRSVRGAAAALIGADLLYRGVTGRSGLLTRALGATARNTHHERTGVPAEAPDVERTIIVRSDAQTLYQLWRNPQQLARVLGQFAEVTPLSENRARWRVHGPMGRELEWEAQVIEDRPGALLRWISLPGASVPNEGRVRFRRAPAGTGTEVALYIRFDPPGGAVGQFIANHFAVVPRIAVERALLRFKSLVEAGELPALVSQSRQA